MADEAVPCSRLRVRRCGISHVSRARRSTVQAVRHMPCGTGCAATPAWPNGSHDRSAAMPTGWPCSVRFKMRHSRARAGEHGQAAAMPALRCVSDTLLCKREHDPVARPCRQAGRARCDSRGIHARGQGSTGRLSPCPRYGRHVRTDPYGTPSLSFRRATCRRSRPGRCTAIHRGFFRGA